MLYLKLAQMYCEEREDGAAFRNIYEGFRLYNGVRESISKTLIYLYDTDVARELQNAARKASK